MLTDNEKNWLSNRGDPWLCYHERGHEETIEDWREEAEFQARLFERLLALFPQAQHGFLKRKLIEWIEPTFQLTPRAPKNPSMGEQATQALNWWRGQWIKSPR